MLRDSKKNLEICRQFGIGCCQIAEPSHWLFSYYLSRGQWVQSGARTVIDKETVVSHAFLKKGMLVTFVVSKCPFLCHTLLWSHCGLIRILIIFWESCLCWDGNTMAKLSASSSELLESHFTFSLPMSSSASWFIKQDAAPWKTCALPNLWVLTEAVLTAWKTSTVLFPRLPLTHSLGFFPSYMHASMC